MTAIVDWRQLQERWNPRDFGDWIHVAVRSTEGISSTALYPAVAAAVETMASAIPRDTCGLWARRPIEAINEVVFQVELLIGVVSTEDFTPPPEPTFATFKHWLTRFAEHPAISGLSLEIGRPTFQSPHVWGHRDSPPRPPDVPTAFIAIGGWFLEQLPEAPNGDRPTRLSPGWERNADLRDELASWSVDWVRQGRQTVYLEANSRDQLVRPDVARAELTTRRRVEWAEPDGSHLRAVSWGSDGRITAQRYQMDHGPLEAVAATKAALVANAGRADQGYIRIARGGAPGWLNSYLQAGGPAAPFRHLAGDVRGFDRHFASDAHGVMLLTGSHLHRARDLSKWLISEVAPDRFLVEAPDLEAWYSGPQPDPDVLAAARHDLGPMLFCFNEDWMTINWVTGETI